jgi:hypothetical protein
MGDSEPIKLNTYTDGFNVKVTLPITKDSMISLCRALEQRFGDGNVFKPEGIGGGFILWADWPGKKDKKDYKCMRLMSNNSWPWVHMDCMTTWVNSEDIVIAKGAYDTFLKAFQNAPAWTLKELNVFKICLEERGFKVGRMPKLTPRKRHKCAALPGNCISGTMG